jgi:serine/threonine protein kinase
VDSPPDLPSIVHLAADIAAGVGHLHAHGVVHADLSAANVLLCGSSMVQREEQSRGASGWHASQSDGPSLVEAGVTPADLASAPNFTAKVGYCCSRDSVTVA